MFGPINSAHKTISILGATIQLQKRKNWEGRSQLNPSFNKQKSRVLFNTYPERRAAQPLQLSDSVYTHF